MRNFKQIREETGHYAKAEEHLSKANDADANGKMASFHAHMSEYHDELSQWHESKGRSATADKHADKADYHHEKSIDLGRGVHEARDTKQELRDAMSRHTRSAIAAKSEGDNDRVKVHQAYINKIKDKLGKMEAMGEEYIEEASPRAQAAFDELDNEVSKARSGKSTAAKDLEDDPGIKDMRDRMSAQRAARDAAETPAQRDDRRAATAARMATPAPDGSKRVSPDDQMDRDIKWFKSQTAKPKVAEERTEIKNAKGEVTSWKDESDWRKTSKVKSGIGKVTNLSDKARRETEKLAKPKMSEEVDDEGSMAKGQLNRMIDQATNLVRIMDDKKQLDGWVQSKLTMASDYLDSAHDYLMHSKQDVDKK